MVDLAEVARRHGTDKYDHNYAPHYERHLVDPAVIVEVGVAHGHSLRMWREFYPQAHVVGIEINPDYDGPGVVIGDAARGETWARVDMAIGQGASPEVIIDDGSHQAADILATFAVAWPRLRLGGWYVIEDLDTTRHPQFGGDLYRGPVGARLWEMLDSAIYGGVELHVYEEIAFIRKVVA